MKAKIKKTGEIVDVRRNEEGLYIQVQLKKPKVTGHWA